MFLGMMNNGVDLTSNKRFTKGYGYFTEMESYEELLKAWDKTIREITRYSVIVEILKITLIIIEKCKRH